MWKSLMASKLYVLLLETVQKHAAMVFLASAGKPCLLSRPRKKKSTLFRMDFIK
jgi:hypothetical protein